MILTSIIASAAILSGLATAASSSPTHSALSSTLSTSVATHKQSSSSTKAPPAKSTATCPPFTVDTTTTTVTDVVYTTTTPRTPQTITNTIEYVPHTTTLVSVLTTTDYTGIVTGTITPYTFLVYTLIVPSATKTVSQPTNPGFTPLLCESEYFRKTKSVTTTFTATIEYTSFVDVTTTASEDSTIVSFTSTSTYLSSVNYTSYTYTYATTTTTVTRIDPTHTVFAACATNNGEILMSRDTLAADNLAVSPDYPGGGYFNQGTPLDGGSYELVPALDAVDCCGLCQRDSSCVASLYFGQGLLNYPPCQLSYKNTTAHPRCDPRYKGVLVSQYPIYNAVVGNGPCGQVKF
ncbi:hypothetical protein AMS68_007526 [Peltaster fructicola]|uniref:Apple domain-containing protein n=1 Tax=Peltaster fructicola TaxID=286661 RepID=A0A6H0Y5A0_9PEZI|nr:hypothetical protein AMS68_007526 [Peltaster fructicola]